MRKFTFWQMQISIHAPRMGSDQINKAMSDLRAISIHAPRMGSDIPAGAIFMPTT